METSSLIASKPTQTINILFIDRTDNKKQELNIRPTNRHKIDTLLIFFQCRC